MSPFKPVWLTTPQKLESERGGRERAFESKEIENKEIESSFLDQSVPITLKEEDERWNIYWCSPSWENTLLHRREIDIPNISVVH